MRRYLLTTAGFYRDRILHGISEIKPDKIIIIIDQDENWIKFQEETVAELKTKLEIPWNRSDSIVVEKWDSLSNYEKCIGNLFRTIGRIRKTDPEAEIYVDITSATRLFTIAVVSISTLYRGLTILYTPRAQKKGIRDLNPKDRNDWGGMPITLLMPYVPALERISRDAYLKQIILSLEEMGGITPSMKALLMNLKGSSKERESSSRNEIVRLSRHVQVLESYGLIATQRMGRRTIIQLTRVGYVVASMFSMQPTKKRKLENKIKAWINRATIFRNIGEHEKAISLLNKVIETKPRYAEAWSEKGSALEELGRYEEALLCFDRALSIEPKNARMWIRKSRILEKVGRLEEAKVSLRKAMEIDPKSLTPS